MITVCIPTIPSRKAELVRLLSVLRPQLIAAGLPEPLVYETKPTREGGRTIGYKRNEMVQAVTTKYVVFVDDDDIVSSTYAGHLKHTITSNVDGMGFRGIMTTNGDRPVEFVHSHRYSWIDAPVMREGSKIYIRPLNHLNPIKTDIAKQIGYKDMPHGEDRDYSERLRASGLVKTEYFVDEFIYTYLYRSRK